MLTADELEAAALGVTWVAPREREIWMPKSVGSLQSGQTFSRIRGNGFAARQEILRRRFVGRPQQYDNLPIQRKLGWLEHCPLPDGR